MSKQSRNAVSVGPSRLISAAPLQRRITSRPAPAACTYPSSVASGLVPVGAGMPAQAGALALLTAARADGESRGVLERRAGDGADLDGASHVGGASVFHLPRCCTCHCVRCIMDVSLCAMHAHRRHTQPRQPLAPWPIAIGPDTRVAQVPGCCPSSAGSASCRRSCMAPLPPPTRRAKHPPQAPTFPARIRWDRLRPACLVTRVSVWAPHVQLTQQGHAGSKLMHVPRQEGQEATLAYWRDA